MPPHPTSQPWDLSYPPAPSSEQHGEEDLKAPYDDLIDQYAIPYRQNPTHKAYAVDPSAFESDDLSQKPSRTTEASDKDLEYASTDGHNWGYPPVAQKEKRERGHWWSAVRLDLLQVPTMPEQTPTDNPGFNSVSLVLVDGTSGDSN
ncbi:hypothetical protein PHLCEN_2v12793 [Hermanssonia centrifuga]|uniref:Uncharacterized protein n=1 Tax=Hermanssonia centrifuga TaxID=98765 RepID=A0A2R6NG45_9APHY|nr:hypothetical protein PHLCEN_2v12793 [Hermanssonia centrifuga]